MDTTEIILGFRDHGGSTHKDALKGFWVLRNNNREPVDGICTRTTNGFWLCWFEICKQKSSEFWSEPEYLDGFSYKCGEIADGLSHWYRVTIPWWRPIDSKRIAESLLLFLHSEWWPRLWRFHLVWFGDRLEERQLQSATQSSKGSVIMERTLKEPRTEFQRFQGRFINALVNCAKLRWPLRWATTTKFNISQNSNKKKAKISNIFGWMWGHCWDLHFQFHVRDAHLAKRVENHVTRKWNVQFPEPNQLGFVLLHRLTHQTAIAPTENAPIWGERQARNQIEN